MRKSKFHDLNISSATLIFTDLIVLSVVFYFFHKISNASISNNQEVMKYLVITTQYIFFTMPTQLTILAVGLYNEKIRENFNGIIVRLSVAFLLSYLFSLTLSLISSSIYFSSQPIELLYITAFTAIVVTRFIAVSCKYEHMGKRRILLLGHGKRANLISSTMRRATDRVNFEIVGYVKFAGDNVVDDRNIKQINLSVPLEKYIIEENIDEVVIALDERRNNLPSESLFYCKLHDIQITDVIDFIERETGQIAVNHIYPSFILYNKKSSDNWVFNFFKWIFNSFIGLIILSVTWPIIILTIICIKIEDGLRAPVFYTQKRVGLKGKVFSICKFRSMVVDAELSGEQMSGKSDSRITRVGRIIRKYRIDELPQLFNIFIGNMSFVGPRPERPQFTKQFEDSIPFYSHRHNVKPGLTGWAQLKYPYGDGLNDAREKLKFDLYYIKHRSLILDILILIRTSEIVIFGKGR
ncbi:TIGR03013 family XrtA/PEP-CTERM system glycosyltransferase [Photobacterium lutimaris]|uniref:Sugar transferase n=1 Tax=Photobacterium lutimaris TaxID=388278 RepID=A0A2T3J588_9GAMM|nr:TIGR03013 family XrtA/PEP-CTERM system glycosyltransferase [Photobacterium lutimaris]PSU36452.1 sugar transferase [Photobacterium lutimaris]